MYYIYVNGKLEKVTSNTNVKWKFLSEYSKKAKSDKKEYHIRVVETRDKIYL